MTELVVKDFFGEPLIICPTQSEKCEHQYPMGEGAFLGCTCKECYQTKICIKSKLS